MTNYSNAANKENALLKYFEYLGFTGCRSAGSRGFWDIMVTPPTSCTVKETLHIQAGPKGEKIRLKLAQQSKNYLGLFAHCFFVNHHPPQIKLLNSSENYAPIHKFVEQVFCMQGLSYFQVTKLFHKTKIKANKVLLMSSNTQSKISGGEI